MISTGTTTEAKAGTLTLSGGTSEQGQGGNVDILGGQSTNAGVGGRVLLGKKYCYFSISIHSALFVHLFLTQRISICLPL